MRYVLEMWIIIEPEEPREYDKLKDVMDDFEQQCMLQPENIYKVYDKDTGKVIAASDRVKKVRCGICGKCKLNSELAKVISIDSKNVYICFVCYGRLRNVPVDKWNIL